LEAGFAPLPIHSEKVRDVEQVESRGVGSEKMCLGFILM
jgi:hypothetical protein